MRGVLRTVEIPLSHSNLTPRYSDTPESRYHYLLSQFRFIPTSKPSHFFFNLIGIDDFGYYFVYEAESKKKVLNIYFCVLIVDYS